VDKEKSREYLVNFVLPAIKAKWLPSDRHKTIYILARTHITPDDPFFLMEAARGCWDIRMVFQLPNSLDTKYSRYWLNRVYPIVISEKDAQESP
jgi:hypothetical protein